MNNRIIIAVLATMASLSGYAQGGSKSPYSQYGLGTIADQSQGFSRGMNGVGLALRKGNVVNTLNPASYSSIDSLTMVFDVGMSGQSTNFKENNTSLNVKNANFEYAVGSFRLFKNVGASFGVLPYSNIGYDYSSTTKLENNFGTVTETYSGSGGMHQAFIGAGWRVMEPLSVGVNVSYFWGTYNRSVATSSSNSNINTITKSYSANVNSYLLTFGAQWQQRLSHRDALTIGATVGVGHKLGADASCQIINVDTTSFVVSNALEVPMTYGLGLGWNHGSNLFVGADVMLQKWGGIDFPEVSTKDNQTIYAMRSGLLKDRYQVNVGADYVPNPISQHFINRIHYRLGAGYATPYYNINGKNGPKELSVSAGFGIPLQNRWNNRSILNVSAQWGHTSATDLITENTFRINVGLTFNERWFAKWKVD